MQELLRHSTIRVTLDTYTQAVTTEKRNAEEAVVTLLCPEKTQEALLGRTLFPVPILCLFVPTREWSASGKFLRMNGGDDGTRTRGLCRDSKAILKHSNDLARTGGTVRN